MAEYIEKQAAIDALGKPTEVYSWEDALMREQWERDKAAIEAIPPADVRPVVRGKWIVEENMHGFLTCECSNCGEITRDTVMGKPKFKYCPMCGAYMSENDA